jgi:SAM-dependent methyltransferase
MNPALPQEQQQEFWEKMAEKYPLPFDEKHLTKTQEIIGMAEQRGVQLDGATILDVGCGTGVYTLPLAQRAAQVTGLDLSSEMILRFEKEQQEHGIENADAIQVPWNDAAVSTHQLENGFDIVWAAMTPAVRTPEAIARMNRCARNWCVYIGWGGVRENAFLQAVFQAHDQTFGPPPGARAVQKHLAAMGISTELELFRDHWEWEGTEEEAAAYAEGMLRTQSEAEPNLDLIREITAGFSTNGTVSHRTDVEKGIMTWQSI